MLTYAPITVIRNPFSILECQPAYDDEKPCATGTAPTASTTTTTTTIEDDDVDLSSWSVVNSACSSDDEEEEEEDDDSSGDTDEIYADIEPGLPTAPLTLSTLKSGFTNISKATTARSTNSVAITAPEIQGTWVLKVGKRKQRKQQQHEPSSASSDLSSHHTSTLPTLSFDHVEKKGEDTQGKDVVEEEDRDDVMYMRMTERELSKSPRAVQIKNRRIAINHDRSLVSSLKDMNQSHFIPEWSSSTDDDESSPSVKFHTATPDKNPKKTLQKMRAPRTKSKSNKNSKKAKLHTDI
ncbi:hypothetical protein BGZ94_003715 [Podila epigama]|nr:hypothetical protein BGZ94_003715 [Podila epigama]